MAFNLRMLRNKAQENIWAFGIVAFLIGTILGTGSLWSYFDHDISNKTLQIEKIQLENQLQEKLLSLHSTIIDETSRYIEVRDAHNSGGADYNLQNQYVLRKANMIKLVSDYNAIEAKLSTSEKRQPNWFKINKLLPPLAPRVKFRDTDQSQTHDPGNNLELFIDVEPMQDEVVVEVVRNLKLLFEQYGQPTKQP